MDRLLEHLLKDNKIVDVGEVKITRISLGKTGKVRYLIYLPMQRNYLWGLIHSSGSKIRAFITIPTMDVIKKRDNSKTQENKD
jgi:hypothetical protein